MKKIITVLVASDAYDEAAALLGHLDLAAETGEDVSIIIGKCHYLVEIDEVKEANLG